MAHWRRVLTVETVGSSTTERGQEGNRGVRTLGSACLLCEEGSKDEVGGSCDATNQQKERRLMWWSLANDGMVALSAGTLRWIRSIQDDLDEQRRQGTEAHPRIMNGCSHQAAVS
jgi:hypothetical protein